MTSLYDEAKQGTRPSATPKKMISVFAGLTKDDARDLARALLDDTISTRSIMLVLNRRGIAITQNPIRTFREDVASRPLIESYL